MRQPQERGVALEAAVPAILRWPGPRAKQVLVRPKVTGTSVKPRRQV